MGYLGKRTGSGLALMLIFALLSGLGTPALAQGDAGLDRLGATPADSLNGGRMAVVDGVVYSAEKDGIYRGETRISDEAGQGINVLAGYLYYTVDGETTGIRRINLHTLETETVLEWSAPIRQLYITDTGLALLLSEDRVYTVDLESLEARAADTALAVSGFIPTGYGNIYATGELGDYTLYAEDRLIAEGVVTFFTEGDYLIVRRGVTDEQIALADCFGAGQAVLQPYTLHDGEVQLYGHTGDGDCPVCAAELESYLAGGTEEAETVTAYTAEPTYSLPLTESQENIVKRAKQQLYIEWSPLSDVTGWRGQDIYEAGESYVGLPYAQPVSQGVYTPWGATLSEFAAAVEDPDSLLYTSNSYNGSVIGPYYGTDCSGFVSYALDLPVRTSTSTFPAYADKITQDLNAVQVGDVFNEASSHNLIVTAVEYYEDGTLAAIETMEQTNPLGKHRRYGEGGESTLTALYNRTLGSGFVLYRSKTVDQVSYTHDHAVYIEGDDCDQCETDAALQRFTITASAGNGGAISPSGAVTVKEGASLTLSVTPDPGFAVSDILVDGESVGAAADYTFEAVDGDHTIEAEFTLSGNPFTDVPEEEWYYDAVLYVYQRGLVTGTTATTFSPDDQITRGQFVTILGRIVGVDTEEYTFDGVICGSDVRFRSGLGTSSAIKTELNQGDAVTVLEGVRHTDGYVWYKAVFEGETGYIRSDFVQVTDGFSDVAIEQYYSKYIQWAAEQEIVNGLGENEFGPDQDLTREQMCAILYNYTVAYSITLPQLQEAVSFSDGDQISSWAADAVTALSRAQMVNGSGGAFHPEGTSTRAETAQIITNFLQKLEA